ncbi:pentatricopeptide repeat-containing protein At5g55740, chloroplastic isoform X2 [Magnolia sinica]|uniref:pentatricopeptide repeat-containing protein At5g55740, chloroplastic isoform X2 n=1 Tax=Magnolia sinica TaxID=86752 RepID=UPI002659CE58|nr:pentatricopeptide repeat-containing protein At5g55740, chloroplastic isoform X2 [Magnolia sinica]
MASLSLPPTPNSSLSPFKSSQTPKSLHFHTPHLTKLHQSHGKRPKSPSTLYFHYISSLCKQGLLQPAFSVLTEMQSQDLPIGPEIYGEILQGCVYERALPPGQQIHAQLLKKGTFFSRNEYIETKVLIFYAKCDPDVAAAVSLFGKLRRRNVFAWAALIGMYCRAGWNEKALLGYCEMQENGFFPDNFIVPNALKACSAIGAIGFGKGVHGYILKMGYGSCVFVASSLVDMYGKCGVLEDAGKVFEEMPERNAVVWNSMIVCYVQNGLNEEAMEVFYDMRVEGVEPTRVTVASFLSSSANLEALDEGRQGHAVAVLNGLELDNILGSALINFYLKVGLIEDAELVFYRMVERDVVTWNLLISGYMRDGKIERSFDRCRWMRSDGLRFDSVTMASVFSACAESANLEIGREGHGYSVRHNLETDVVVASSIIDMYAKCERIDDARRVFNVTTQRDLVLWNTLIAAYAQRGLSGEALKLFYQMQLEGVPPNVVSWNSVILGFMRNGQVNEAEDTFSQMRSTGLQPNLITWTTLISGFAQNGYWYEAILVFQQMQYVGLRPNTVSIVGVLLACSNLASLQYGKAIHGHIRRRGLCSSLSVVTSLVSMYSKCGSLTLAERVFEMALSKEIPLYNAMISGYAFHGQATQALALFTGLQKEGMDPDEITFTNVLCACSHAGLVDEGLKFFSDMVSLYHMRPSMVHYGCVVSLLSRFGNLEGALSFISAMPFKPDARILGSLLAACREHNEIELAAGRWKEVSEIRDVMKEKGLRKNPGCSWIQIGREIHTFVAGDRLQPQTDMIYDMLALLEMEMRFLGYAPMVQSTEQSNVWQEIACS